MHSLLRNYFTFSRLKAQFAGRKLSWLAFYDAGSEISPKAAIQRFVNIRESTIGAYSYIGHTSNIFRAQIGKFCSVSRYVNIGLSSHPINTVSSSPIFFSANNVTGHRWIDKDVYDDRPDPVAIGNDVWIGMNTTIMGGVTVGNGAVIAAHSVVTKDIPPYAIVAGIPAKIIRYRFDDELIKQLEESNWWDLPEELIRQNIAKFQGEISPDSLVELSKLSSKK
jgi:acetyltransferase-like isoleucine patch superfamily enzyme